jgi:hypothetical protein
MHSKEIGTLRVPTLATVMGVLTHVHAGVAACVRLVWRAFALATETLRSGSDILTPACIYT